MGPFLLFYINNLTDSPTFFKQVDESLISSTSDNGIDDPITQQQPPSRKAGLTHILSSSGGGVPASSSYSWVQMALPGGGIVSVPIECASVGSASSSAAGANEDGGGGSQYPLQYGASSAVSTQQLTGANNNSSSSGQTDVLTVAAGEPVTHFNLDQLLEIVQSFQLDTTMAGHIPDHSRPNVPNMASRSSHYAGMVHIIPLLEYLIHKICNIYYL